LPDLKIFNYDYYNIIKNEYNPEFTGPVLVICGRDKDGKFHRIRCLDDRFKPHFYVPDDAACRLKCQQLGLEFEEWPYPSVYDKDEKVLIVYADFPFRVAKVRDYFPHTYEADVKWASMAMMKLNLDRGYIRVPDLDWVTADQILPIPEEEEFYVKPRVFYFDIETDFEGTTDFDLERAFIISLVVYDNYLNRYDTFEWDEHNGSYWKEERTVERDIKRNNILPRNSAEVINHCTDEREVLSLFFNLFTRKPDAICGFNSHGGNQMQSYKSKSRREWSNGFDEPVIYKRAIAHNLLKQMQKMSPLPNNKNAYGHYYGCYTRGRGEKFEVVIRCITPLDILYDVPKLGYTQGFRDFFGGGLENYLQYFAKIGKLKHQGLSVAQFKKKDLYSALHYNRRDVEGCFYLDELFGYSNDVFDTVALAQVPGIDILYATKIHAFLTLKYSQDKCVYDTRWGANQRKLWPGWLEEKKDHYGIVMKHKYKVGGYNVEMMKGGQGWTIVVDFSGLYPNLLMSANAGADTIVCVKEEHDDYFIDFNMNLIPKDQCNHTPSAPFWKKEYKEAIDVQIWKKLLNYRKKLKQQLAEEFDRTGDTKSEKYKLLRAKEYNLKQRLINNKFGVMGNRGFLGFMLPLYNVAPSMGQPLVRLIAEEFLPQHGAYARGGDTDSVFVGIDGTHTIEEIIKIADELVVELNKFVNIKMKELFNIESDSHTIVMDWEKIGPYFYGHMKKNYLVEVWAQDGKVLSKKNRYTMYKGFELKKKNRSNVTEMVQKAYLKVAKKVYEQNLDVVSEFYNLIQRIDNIYPQLKWSDICSRITLKRDLKSYSPNFPNRRAAEFSNERFATEFTVGSIGYMGYPTEQTDPRKKTYMMFTDDDVETIKTYGYELDVATHKQKFVINKLNYLFSDYNLNWLQIEDIEEISDICEM